MPKKSSFKIDVAPEMETYRVLQNTPYDKCRALAEFVDNSIQSYLDNKSPLTAIHGNQFIPEIEIYIYSKNFLDTKKRNSIIIKDNSAGIRQKDFQRALRPGALPDKRTARSLGQYGIGMKTAAVWFSDHWTIETTNISSAKKLKLDFNLTTLIENNNSKIDVIETDIEPKEHFTIVSLLNQHHPVESREASEEILKELEEIFILFIRKKEVLLHMFYNDEKVETADLYERIEPPKVLTAPEYDRKGAPITDKKAKVWRKDLAFQVGKKEVSGYVFIREKGSYVNNPGIRLFKNNRLIEGSCRHSNIPINILGTGNKYAAQRVYGELHLDDFFLDFSKSKFLDKDDDTMAVFYKELKNSLEEGTLNIIEQTENYRSKKGRKKKETGRDAQESILEEMLSELQSFIQDQKLMKLLREMKIIIKAKKEKECPILIATGLRSILEKSLYKAAKDKIYQQGDRVPGLSKMLTDIKDDKKHDIIPSQMNSLFAILAGSTWSNYLNSTAHNSYVPQYKDNETFAINFRELIIYLYKK